MIRERALRIVLGLVGVLFSAAIYPAINGLRNPVHSDSGDTMMMSLYFALGIFLLLAIRNPQAHRSLIAFAAWSSFAHAVIICARVRNRQRAGRISHRLCRPASDRCCAYLAGAGNPSRAATPGWCLTAEILTAGSADGSLPRLQSSLLANPVAFHGLPGLACGGQFGAILQFAVFHNSALTLRRIYGHNFSRASGSACGQLY